MIASGRLSVCFDARIITEYAQVLSRPKFRFSPDNIQSLLDQIKAVGVAVKVCQNALKAAHKAGVDTLILDTAGRLHIDDDLMNELRGVQPRQRLFSLRGRHQRRRAV